VCEKLIDIASACEHVQIQIEEDLTAFNAAVDDLGGANATVALAGCLARFNVIGRDMSRNLTEMDLVVKELYEEARTWTKF